MLAEKKNHYKVGMYNEEISQKVEQKDKEMENRTEWITKLDNLSRT